MPEQPPHVLNVQPRPSIVNTPRESNKTKAETPPEVVKEPTSISIKVVFFDPGITTGYAQGVIDNGKLGAVSGQALWDEISLYNQLQLYRPDLIGYERFDYRSESAYGRRGNLAKVDLFPRNLIGVINLYAQQRGIQPDNPDGLIVEPVQQMPAQALGKNAYWSDEKLKSARMYKTANPHANDAMRHLLYWFQFGSGYKYNTNGIEPLA